MASKAMSESSVASDTEHFEGNNDDNETTESARERFQLDLSEKGINADLVFHEEGDGEDDDLQMRTSTRVVDHSGAETPFGKCGSIAPGR